jgi:hypothetical protein
MCIGFAVGDALYLWLAGLAGYSEPFTELPVLSVLLVAFFMTAPMTAWMVFRGMPRRPVAEMSAAMPIIAVSLLAMAAVGALPSDDLVAAEHGLMMPAMLVAMLLRLDVYTGGMRRYSTVIASAAPSATLRWPRNRRPSR